jgi:hypothetical protein
VGRGRAAKIRQAGLRRVVPLKEKNVQLILHINIPVALEEYLSFVQHER